MTSIRPGFIIRCFSNGFNRLISVTQAEQREGELEQNLSVSLSSLINHLETNFLPTRGGGEEEGGLDRGGERGRKQTDPDRKRVGVGRGKDGR